MYLNSIDKKETLKFTLIVVSIYTILNLFGTGCPIKFFTGISCAGCGMTRAWISLLQLDIKGAFHYHPLVIVPLIYIVIYFFKNKLSKKLRKILVYIGIMLFAVVYIFRILNPDDTTVDINIKNGLIYKFLKIGGIL